MKGSIEIDKIIRPLGRVRLRTGTKDKRIAQRYLMMLEDLPLDVVRMLRDRVLTLRETYDLWSRGETKLLPTAQTLRPLGDSMRAWVVEHESDVSESERKKRLAAIDLLPAGRVKELPKILRGLRNHYRDRGAQFNHLRTIYQAFVRDTVGVSSPLYAELREVRTLPTPAKQHRGHCTVQHAKAVRDALPGRWGRDWWAMCCSGMGPKEYFEDGWKVLPVGIQIHGQKKRSRDRIVPYVVAPQPGGSIDGFEAAVSRADLGVAPYDARRSYERWLEELRLPAYRISGYLGHGPKSMTQLYGWGDVKAWLAEDAVTIRQYVGEPLKLRVEA